MQCKISFSGTHRIVAGGGSPVPVPVAVGAAVWVLLAVFVLALFGGAGMAGAQSQAQPEAAGAMAPVQALSSTGAMVVTANPHATRAGIELLRAGGNAVDAALAAQFALNVVEPQSSGIGGGGFMLLHRGKDGRLVALDGRETAPAAATPGLFLQPDGKPVPFFPQRITGGRPVGVPGIVALAELALRKYGSKSMAQVLAPAIRLAEGGFPVSPRLALLLDKFGKRLPQFPATRKIFFDAEGKPLAEGTLLRQPDLAGTFRLLASKGAEGFYRGTLAREIVRAVREAPVNPGRMQLADLAAYRVLERQPVKGAYRGYTIAGAGPPTSGGVTLIQILQLLEQAPGRAKDSIKDPTGEAHRFAQAARLAYADRGRYLADPAFAQVPVRGLLSKEYARQRAKALAWDGALTDVKPGLPPGASAGAGLSTGREGISTTHLVVVDRARNVVSMTSSIEMAFGSGMVVPGRGFLLNNQLTDFSAKPRDDQGRLIANRVQPGKRPRSSMAPTIVLRDGRPVLALGSPGGSRIIQYVARVLTGVLSGKPGKGLSLQQAIQRPHVSHLGGVTALEPGAMGLRERLEALGHKVREREQTSGLHGVWLSPYGRLHAGVDPRREGLALGLD